MATADRAMPAPSPRLINEDLAPAKERHWGTWHLFCMWMSDVHSIGGYTFAAGLFFLGLASWQVLAALIIGILVVYVAMNLTGFAGQRLGVPYPVFSRISFGVFGANLPALIRAVIAIIWYGIQTYLASVAVVVLALRIVPSWKGLADGGFLGLSPVGWACFLFGGGIRLVLLGGGVGSIRRYQDFAGPAIWVVMFILTAWMVARAGSLGFSVSSKTLPTGKALLEFFSAISLVVAYFSTLMLNFCDFSRFAPDRRAVVVGNFWGLPINFAAATVGINIVANFVSPAYDLANVAPKYINFQRGGMISAVVAILVLPWKIFSSPVAVNYFLGGLAAFLGPLYGIIISDYYLLRRQQVEVDGLFQEEGSPYWYRGGWNPVALAAFFPAAAISAVIALVPAFKTAAPFSWFIGAALGAGIYQVLASRPGVQAV